METGLAGASGSARIFDFFELIRAIRVFFH